MTVTPQTGWRDMGSAPRDRTRIIAIVAPGRGFHLEHQAGRPFIISHEGTTENGYDLGWAVYPGFGGCSDHDFACWHPMPPLSEAPSPSKERRD